jgi:hypothetical protein
MNIFIKIINCPNGSFTMKNGNIIYNDAERISIHKIYDKDSKELLLQKL